MIYLLMFGITAGLGALVQREKCAGIRAARIFLSMMIILIPSILGGLRSSTLGTDNITYAKQFETAVTTSARTILFSGNTEIMNRVLRLVVSRLTKDYHWYFFAVEVITMAFAYGGMYYFREKVPLWQSLLVYLFCFYCLRIHLIWQGAALAVVFFAFRYIELRRPVKYFLLVGLAMLFHMSAIIGALIWVFYRILEMPDGGERPVKLHPGVLVVSIFALIILLPVLTKALVQIGILPKSYATYANGPLLKLDREETVTRLPLLIIATVLYRDMSGKEPMWRFLYVMLWTEFLIAQYGSSFSHAWRISLYFGYFNMITIPCLIRVVRDERGERTAASFLMIAYLAAFWVYWFVLNNRGFTYPVYPYISDVFPALV